MKKETIAIIVSVLVVVSFVLGMLAGDVFDPFMVDEKRGAPFVVLYECENGTATWFKTYILYGTENTVYPDSYRISFSLRNTITGEITNYTYTYCELRR